MRLYALTLCAATVFAASAVIAQDNLITANPDAIAAQLQAAGLKTEIGTDSVGDPSITSIAADSNFEVYFYGCTAGKDCLSVQMNACFDAPEGITFEVINTWNFDMRYGKASLDDAKDPCLKMDVDLTKGVAAATFQSSLKTWVELLGRFRAVLTG
jgi:hypothetical protein